MSQLSKSDFMLFLRHPAWLWLKKHRRNVLPKPDAALQALFDSGHRFEAFAEERFPNAIRLGFDGFHEYRSLPRRTHHALSKGAETILQGRFESGRTTCIIDVLQRVHGNTFDLFEIKASTSVKPEHIPDLAFQKMVLEGAGLSIRKLGIIHVNREYVRSGHIQSDALSEISDATQRVDRVKDETIAQVKQALNIADLPAMPDVSPRHLKSGSLNNWMEVFEAVNGATAENSVHHLISVKPEQLGKFEDAGIKSIDEIPDNFDLTERQRRQVTATKSGQRKIDHTAIKSFLSQVQYPIYFLDYETLSDVVPPFDGTRPYQQVPFQYSLHIQREPGADLEHREYLHEEKSNPVPPLLEQLQRDIGDKGSGIVWYDSFETRRNTEMGEMSPSHAAFLKDINDRVIDLMDPFYKGWFVDHNFHGSSSIKKVLPVLVPDLSYAELSIHDGETAKREWMDLVLHGKGSENRAKTFENLRSYCKLDTLAMVRIFDFLKQLRE